MPETRAEKARRLSIALLDLPRHADAERGEYACVDDAADFLSVIANERCETCRHSDEAGTFCGWHATEVEPSRICERWEATPDA